jgi:hypothetical protein
MNTFSKIIVLAGMLLITFQISFIQAQSAVYVLDIGNAVVGRNMERDMVRVFDHINSSYKNGQKPTWTGLSDISARFKEDVNAIWETSRIRIDEDTLFRPAIELSGGNYEIRDIQISLVTADSVYYEEAVLTFSPSGKIQNFMIGLPQHRYSRYIFEATEEIDRKRRQVILNFIEQFRTAYNTKNLRFIREVFSDQALIIVGNVVNTSTEGSPFQQQVQYLRFTKDEYLTRLDRVFAQNRFIDINFSDISILRHPNQRFDKIYGVNLVQNYRSSNYADDGYLFLLIDFRKDELNPIIHVRTWQPMDVTQKDEVFMIGDFALY